VDRRTGLVLVLPDYRTETLFKLCFPLRQQCLWNAIRDGTPPGRNTGAPPSRSLIDSFRCYDDGGCSMALKLKPKPGHHHREPLHSFGILRGAKCRLKVRGGQI
jgi:hypothetical protein